MVALFFIHTAETIMEGSIYSNLGLKKNRTFQEKRDSKLYNLREIIERKFIVNEASEFKQAFINDLKNVLLKDDVFQLIESFFFLEQNLHLALEQVDFDTPVLNFEEFYRNLSPVLMRALLENVNNSSNAEAILNSIKESIRIALEEELHQIDDQY